MSGILSIATASLSAFHRAVLVTANNVANITNEIYSRQSVIFSATPSQNFGGTYLGTGVKVSNILRNNDGFAQAALRNALSLQQQYETFYTQASQIDKLFSQNGANVSDVMQSFFQSLSSLTPTADSVAARNVFLGQAGLMVNQFNNMQQYLDEYQKNTTDQISQAVSTINQLSSAIASINVQLANNPGAPELLDQRDELLNKLSAYADITVMKEGDSVNVAIGNGQMLVLGAEYNNLAVNLTNSGQFGTQIVLENGNSVMDITNSLSTGSIGGLLHFQNQILGPASQILGQMAMGLAMTFNAQHQLGLDLNGQIGQNFFTDFNQPSLQSSRSVVGRYNTGTANIAVQISNINQLKASDYELTVTDAATNQITLVRKSDGQTSVLNWSSSPPAPPAGAISIDGMTIQVDDIANLANNDVFTLTPTRGAAGLLSLEITDPRKIALASPVKTEYSLTNTGSGAIQLGQVFNTSNVNQDYQIVFISPTQYNIVTSSSTTGPMTYVPNTNNTIMIPDTVNPSYSIVISGSPQTGDQFTASYNIGGIADSGNGTLLAAIAQSKFFEGGTDGLYDKYSGLIASVGGQTYQAKLGHDAYQVLYEQALDFRDSISSVDPDEEAGNLLRFKEAYAAAGQLLAVANDMINVLFNVMG